MSFGGGCRVFCRVAPATLGGLVLFPCIYVVCVAIFLAGVLLASQYLRAVEFRF